MDTLRGNFGSPYEDDDQRDYDLSEDDTGVEPPPAGIGTDERRMQVRAYNHWASLLDDKSFPSIEDLEPDQLPDFGPYSVLLDFSTGIEDPMVQYLGNELAAECGDGQKIDKLSDVPARSLLSRITDHYMQILANQAPIGFEAEFVNQRGATILYRGILLPFSSDDDTIDFIYGVINWKEMADQITTDELLLEIDQALETADGDASDDEFELARDPDPVTDWADGPAVAAGEDAADPAPVADFPDFSDDEGYGEEDEDDLPHPSFGMDVESLIGDYGEEEEGDEESDSRFASLLGASPEPSGGYDPDSDEDEEYDDWDMDPLADIGSAASTDAQPPVPEAFEPEEGEETEFTVEPAATYDNADDAVVEEDSIAEAFADDGDEIEEDEPVLSHPVESIAAPKFEEPVEAEVLAETDEEEPKGLYDCLADARELAQAARSCEDRSRNALYAAVGRAYDVSLAAEEEPAEFDELIAENGLSVQDRAPMTPVVKLVFGADYDKTRLTEYAAVLSHAHRVGIERGELANFLGKADGGLKGVVNAERRLRREEAGKPVDPVDAPREKLAKKLRKIAPIALEDLDPEGGEFGLVMIRRLESGEIVLLGEVPEDIPLIERAARKIIG